MKLYLDFDSQNCLLVLKCLFNDQTYQEKGNCYVTFWFQTICLIKTACDAWDNCFSPCKELKSSILSHRIFSPWLNSLAIRFGE